METGRRYADPFRNRDQDLFLRKRLIVGDVVNLAHRPLMGERQEEALHDVSHIRKGEGVAARADDDASSGTQAISHPAEVQAIVGPEQGPWAADDGGQADVAAVDRCSIFFEPGRVLTGQREHPYAVAPFAQRRDQVLAQQAGSSGNQRLHQNRSSISIQARSSRMFAGMGDCGFLSEAESIRSRVASAARRTPSRSGTLGTYPSSRLALSIECRWSVPKNVTPSRVRGGGAGLGRGARP